LITFSITPATNLSKANFAASAKETVGI